MFKINIPYFFKLLNLYFLLQNISLSFLIFKQLIFPHRLKTMKHFDGLLFQLITK